METNLAILQSFQSLSVSATDLDFGPEFIGSKTHHELVATINQYLKLHSTSKVRRFRLLFSPYNAYLQDIENWIAFAVAKGVEELDLDLSVGSDCWTAEYADGVRLFKLPDCLFHCKSLIHISLSHCEFNPPSSFTGFNHLQSLSLGYVTITENTLSYLLANCQLLDSLRLKRCLSLTTIKVSGQDLRLQRLSIDNCWDCYVIEILAPKLQSFIFNGEYTFEDVNTASLVDACICSIDAENSEIEHDYIKLLSDISHVKILTICSATPSRVTIYEEVDAESLPIILPNLTELQLLQNAMTSDELASIYGFFRLCPSPSLEKLFIQLRRMPEYLGTWSVFREVEEPECVVFEHLKTIKMSNFIGCEVDMKLVRFLLERALVLESMVLVAPEKPEVKLSMDVDQINMSQSRDTTDMTSLWEELVLLPKASAGANIVLCEYIEDNKTLNPTHTVYYYDHEILRIM